MWRMYCVCLLSVIVVLDLLGQSHVNRTLITIDAVYHHIDGQSRTQSLTEVKSRGVDSWNVRVLSVY